MSYTRRLKIYYYSYLVLLTCRCTTRTYRYYGSTAVLLVLSIDLVELLDLVYRKVPIISNVFIKLIDRGYRDCTREQDTSSGVVYSRAVAIL
eukprot:COSAG05_NODE_744_length_7586_cov_230.209964_1_plen_92_part_00